MGCIKINAKESVSNIRYRNGRKGLIFFLQLSMIYDRGSGSSCKDFFFLRINFSKGRKKVKVVLTKSKSCAVINLLLK